MVHTCAGGRFLARRSVAERRGIYDSQYSHARIYAKAAELCDALRLPIAPLVPCSWPQSVLFLPHGLDGRGIRRPEREIHHHQPSVSGFCRLPRGRNRRRICLLVCVAEHVASAHRPRFAPLPHDAPHAVIWRRAAFRGFEPHRLSRCRRGGYAQQHRRHFFRSRFGLPLVGLRFGQPHYGVAECFQPLLWR